MMQPAAQPAGTPSQPDTFDVVVCEKFRKFMKEQIFPFHPEVRSLACTIDWFGALNDAHINHGIWLCDQGRGTVVAPDAVYGSIMQSLRMLDTQCSRALELNQHLREQVQILATEVLNKNEELKKVEEALAARRAELASLGGTAPRPADGD